MHNTSTDSPFLQVSIVTIFSTGSNKITSSYFTFSFSWIPKGFIC